MSSKSRYTALVNDSRTRAKTIQHKQKTADALISEIDALKNQTTTEINELILPRLEHLAKVGRTVLSKAWGIPEQELLPRQANGAARWTLYDFTITKVTEQNIYIQGKRHDHEKLFVLSRDYLHLSSGDFAKRIRSSMPYMKKMNKEESERRSVKDKEEIQRKMRVLQWELDAIERKATS